MEDVSENAVVDYVFVIIQGFNDAAHVFVEELKLTAHIEIDGRRTEDLMLKPLT